MARKRPNPLDDPPAASSSEEEDEDEDLPEHDDEDKLDNRPNSQRDASESEEAAGDEDDEDEDDDEDEEEVDEQEPEKEKIRPPHNPVSRIPNPRSDESETESDSAGFALSLRPHTSDSKPKNQSTMRPVEGGKESKVNVKKAKPENGGGGEVEKKSGIVRVWNEEDEIAVLKGMIEFHEKNGVDPNSDYTSFHEFVKKSISFDVSKSQLMDKVRRLKNKYKNNAEKGVEDHPGFLRPHELKAFELSKTIWGPDGGNVVKSPANKKKKIDSADENGEIDSADKNGKIDVVMALPIAKSNAFNIISKKEPKHSSKAVVKLEQEQEQEQGKFSDLYPFLNLSLKSSSVALMSRGMAETMESCLVSMDKSKLQELDKEWKKQILDEAQVSLGRSNLLQKQLQLLNKGLDSMF